MAIRSISFLQRLRSFSRGESGMAAVEFAVTLPFLLTAYLGGVELGDGIAIDRKVAITTRAVADLAAQYTTIYNSDMSNILGATSVIVAPYPSTPLAVTVSEVTVDAKGSATVTWSDTKGGTAHAVGTAVTLPGTLGAATGSVYSYIWGEVSYAYTPTLGYVMTGTYDLTDTFYLNPRLSTKVCQNTTSC